ncbi:OmpA family protein [Rhodospirillum sp. A1_3_36]|uniref:OmpA family protein n=1 Tax=Rhodospirillum sp. A1_3_36 TaxID=3391666 RepID=UPI0039A69B35
MGRQARQTHRVPSVRGLYPAVGTLLLLAGSISTGMAQGYTYAGTSNNADPYAYLSDLAENSSSGVIVNNAGMNDGLLMPNGTYPRSYGPTLVIGGGALAGKSPVDAMGNPVSRSYLPGGTVGRGAPMAALPPRTSEPKAPAPSRPAAVPVERTESRPAPMRAATVEPSRITVPDPEPVQAEPKRIPKPPTKTAVIEPPPPSPVVQEAPAKAKPEVEEVKVVEAPKAAPPVRLSSGQGPIRLSAGVGPIRVPEESAAPRKQAAPAPKSGPVKPAPPKPTVADAEPVKTAPVRTPPIQTAAAPAPATPPPPPPVTQTPAAPATSVPQPAAASQAASDPQVAARTAPVVQTDGVVSLSFAEGTPDLPPDSEDRLKRIVKLFSKDAGQRIRILAYANDAEGTSNQAKRLSLTRALNVRAYLMEQGIRSPNIEVRAMGSQGAGANPDRVDISVTP